MILSTPGHDIRSMVLQYASSVQTVTIGSKASYDEALHAVRHLPQSDGHSLLLLNIHLGTPSFMCQLETALHDLAQTQRNIFLCAELGASESLPVSRPQVQSMFTVLTDPL